MAALDEVWPPADWQPAPNNLPVSPVVTGRRIDLTPASRIKMRAVRWLWDERLALGTLALIAGREGLGKSTIAYWLVAQVTRGRLPGSSAGDPRAVLIAATEDSWEHTIVPRLVAAGADLDRVFRVEVITSEETHASLVLPADNAQLEAAIRETGAALLLLDPLMSRIGGELDTHKDGDVRRALEPIVSIADRAGVVVVGLIHLNKGTHTDLLTSIMASRAFTAVARTVLAAVPGPEDDGTRLFGLAKSNLGRTDLPARSYRIEAHPLVDGDGVAFTTARVSWLDEVAMSIDEAMRASGGDADERAAATEAARWLVEYLEMQGGRTASSDAKRDGLKAGHSSSALDRARRRARAQVERVGFPAVSYWISAELAAKRAPVKAPDTCRRCSGRLDDVNGTGYHPGCEEE